MNGLRKLTRLTGSLALAALAVVGCTVVPVGPYSNANVVGAPDYYEPYGGPAYDGWDYGGWGNNFLIGPFGRGGGDRYGNNHGMRGRDAPNREQHAFHGAPAGRASPSIPQRAHGGQRSSGGGRGGTRR